MAKLAVERTLSHDCFERNGSKELLSFHAELGYHIILERVLCHSNGMISSLTDASLF